MKYAFIDQRRSIWPVCVQCCVLGVSATGYHQHRLRRAGIAHRRHMTDEALLAHIRAIHAEMRGAYGWPRIWRELRKRGLRVGKQRVQQLMRANGIRARSKRRFRVATTDTSVNPARSTGPACSQAGGLCNNFGYFGWRLSWGVRWADLFMTNFSACTAKGRYRAPRNRILRTYQDELQSAMTQFIL